MQLFSKDICNSLVDIYIDYDLERKQLSSEKIVKFIEIRKDSVQKKLVLTEKKIRRFKKINDFDNRNIIKEKQIKKLEDIEKELIRINSNIDLLNQFDLMFGKSLSTEITSSSIKNISLLTNIFYNDELIKSMITQLQEDVLKRELLLKEVTKNNKKFIQLNRQIDEEVLYIKKAVKLLKESYKSSKLKITDRKNNSFLEIILFQKAN